MNRIPKVSDSVKVRKEQFGLLLVSKRTPILALNEDSMIIWNYIDGNRTIREIAEEINAQMDGDFADTQEIVKLFVDNCYDLGLIEFKK